MINVVAESNRICLEWRPLKWGLKKIAVVKGDEANTLLSDIIASHLQVYFFLIWLEAEILAQSTRFSIQIKKKKIFMS